MNRKAILGRAALSFPAIDGVLDIDQILETDPWNQINDFVHNNFAQNILNEFNERIRLNPKLAPTDSNRPGRKEATISTKTIRKNRMNRANEGKKDKVALANGGQKSREQKKIIPKEDNGKKEKTDEPEREKAEKETDKVKKWAVDLKNEGNRPKKIITRHSTTVTSTKAENKCSNASRTRKSEQIVTVKSSIKNSTENNSGIPQEKENKKKAVSRKNDGGEKEQSKFAGVKKGEEKPTGEHVAKNKMEKKKPKGETNHIENSSKIVARKNAIATKGKANGVKEANASIIRKPTHVASIIKATKNTAMNNSAVSLNVSRRSSKLPIRTSTPKRNNSRISNSSRKENATVKYNVSTTKKDISVECNVSIKNHCTTETCPKKQLNGNRCISTSGRSVKCKVEDTRTMKVKKEQSLENNETSLDCKLTATLKCNKQNEEMAKTAEERKVGKFEKRLIEKEEKRKKRKIRRHERRAERAMEEFGHHVMRIVKEMDYFSENEEMIAGIGSSDESSYSDSYSSWSSCSSCSSCTYCSACS